VSSACRNTNTAGVQAKAEEASKTRDEKRTTAQPEVLTLPIAILRFTFISSRSDLVDRATIRCSARDCGSEEVAVGTQEQARIRALSISIAGKAVQHR